MEKQTQEELNKIKEKLDGLLEKWIGFNQYDANLLSKIKLVKWEKGSVVYSMNVDPELCNMFGTLHGGAQATLVDVLGSMAIFSLDPTPNTIVPSVSVEISVNYASSAPRDSTVYIHSNCYKQGKNLVFTETTIKNDKDEVVCKGSHTKFVLKSKM
ncbi:hypothetical protein CYY_008991 [Polysphondylium violaceum]|uniref:Acyl-coenzyme A thioesterase 13 n=1 Tax=Polysphondylium violaceum TaxID=133409 RepID=A0A8J4PMD2_9MYCE|nr:hypothetical protein CYY_008991 [Polysphondylium violaceum]